MKHSQKGEYMSSQAFLSQDALMCPSRPVLSGETTSAQINPSSLVSDTTSYCQSKASVGVTQETTVDPPLRHVVQRLTQPRKVSSTALRVCVSAPLWLRRCCKKASTCGVFASNCKRKLVLLSCCQNLVNATTSVQAHATLHHLILL
jgi:hypothetical protein